MSYLMQILRNKHFCKNFMTLPLLLFFAMTIAEIMKVTTCSLFPFLHCQNPHKLPLSKRAVLQNKKRKNTKEDV